MAGPLDPWTIFLDYFLDHFFGPLFGPFIPLIITLIDNCRCSCLSIG